MNVWNEVIKPDIQKVTGKYAPRSSTTGSVGHQSLANRQCITRSSEFLETTSASNSIDFHKSSELTVEDAQPPAKKQRPLHDDDSSSMDIQITKKYIGE